MKNNWALMIIKVKARNEFVFFYGEFCLLVKVLQWKFVEERDSAMSYNPIIYFYEGGSFLSSLQLLYHIRLINSLIHDYTVSVEISL